MAVSVKAGAPGAVGELLLSPSFVTVLVLEIGSRSLVLASASPAVLVELCPSGRGLFALGTSLATAVLATGFCNSVLAPSLVAFESLVASESPVASATSVGAAGTGAPGTLSWASAQAGTPSKNSVADKFRTLIL